MNSRIELLVMIDYAALTGALDTAGIHQPRRTLSAATARRMACNAGIIPVVMGGNSQPLDLGRRKRFFTKAQKRAIAARDRGCANPGCSMPAHRTEVHHIKPILRRRKNQCRQRVVALHPLPHRLPRRTLHHRNAPRHPARRPAQVPRPAAKTQAELGLPPRSRSRLKPPFAPTTPRHPGPRPMAFHVQILGPVRTRPPLRRTRNRRVTIPARFPH